MHSAASRGKWKGLVSELLFESHKTTGMEALRQDHMSHMAKWDGEENALQMELIKGKATEICER